MTSQHPREAGTSAVHQVGGTRILAIALALGAAGAAGCKQERVSARAPAEMPRIKPQFPAQLWFELGFPDDPTETDARPRVTIQADLMVPRWYTKIDSWVSKDWDPLGTVWNAKRIHVQAGDGYPYIDLYVNADGDPFWLDSHCNLVNVIPYGIRPRAGVWGVLRRDLRPDGAVAVCHYAAPGERDVITSVVREIRWEGLLVTCAVTFVKDELFPLPNDQGSPSPSRIDDAIAICDSLTLSDVPGSPQTEK